MGAGSNLPNLRPDIEFKNPIQVHFCLESDFGTRIVVSWPNAGCERTLTPDQFNVMARGQDIVNRKSWIVLEMELELANNLKPTSDTVIATLQREIAAWADVVHPNRTFANAMDKLTEEVLELIDSGESDPMEFADVLILVMDAAALAGIDIEKATRDKMAINRQREWMINPNGILNHVGQ